MKKRVVSMVFACLMLAAVLGGCGGGSSKDFDLHFKNDLDVEIHGVYVSPVEDDTWGDKLNLSVVKSGSTIGFDFTKIGEDAGPDTYDIGVIDENAINYDIGGVDLEGGDTITLSGDEEEAVITVTHADGKKDSYDLIPDE